MKNTNDYSGCGLVAMIVKLVALLALLGGDVVKMCSRGARIVDDIPTRSWTKTDDVFKHADGATFAGGRTYDEIFGHVQGAQKIKAANELARKHNNELFDAFLKGNIDTQTYLDRMQKIKPLPSVHKNKPLAEAVSKAKSKPKPITQLSNKTSLTEEECIKVIINLDDELLASQRVAVKRIVRYYTNKYQGPYYNYALFNAFARSMDVLKLMRFEYGEADENCKAFEQQILQLDAMDMLF